MFVASKAAWSHFSLVGEIAPNPSDRFLQNWLRTVPALCKNGHTLDSSERLTIEAANA